MLGCDFKQSSVISRGNDLPRSNLPQGSDALQGGPQLTSSLITANFLFFLFFSQKMRGPVSPMGNLPVPREKRLGKYSGARDDRVRDDWIADAERAVRGSRVERLSGVPETSKDVRVKRWAKNRAKLVSKPRFSSCYRSGKDGHFVRDCPEPALATRTKEGRRSALKKPAGNVKSRSGSPLPRMVGGTPTRTAKMAGVELSAW